MRKNNDNLKIIATVIMAILIIAFFVTSIIKDNNKEESYYSPDFTYNEVDYRRKNNQELVLFVGLDAYTRNNEDSYRNNNLADTIILLVIDNNDNKILPIQINRDTMCEYPILGVGNKLAGNEYGQIALAHSYGDGGIVSLVNVKDAVSELLTGININEYLSITMDAVGIVNDEAGGVEVYIEDDFSNIDSSLTQDSYMTLTGDQALTYVRSRMGLDDSSNVARMNRQKEYLKSLYDKSKSLIKEDADYVARTFNAISPYLVANLDIYALSDLTNKVLEYEVLDSIKLNGEIIVDEDGYVQNLLDQEELIDFCLDTFYEVIKH